MAKNGENGRGEKKKAMASSNSVQFLLLLFFHLLHAVSASSLQNHESVARRVLMSFKETPQGNNVTFECYPSGPCVPCQYSEKSDAKYRCSETGYRIPFKCLEVEDGSKNANGQKPQKTRSTLEMTLRTADVIKNRNLLGDLSEKEGGGQAYITYRSCIPSANEEKLSVIGFEVITLFLLLISGSVVYFRRKRTVTMSGVAAARIQTNSRF